MLTTLDQDVRAVDKNTLEPILYLLESSDIEVQRAASAALGNLAVDGTHPPSSICPRTTDRLTHIQHTTRS